MSNVTIRTARPEDHAEWLRKGQALWEDFLDDQQVREMEEIIASQKEEVFVAERPSGGLCGFVEASIRPWAIGYEARPVGYVEVWYVDEDFRRQGVGRALVEAAEG